MKFNSDHLFRLYEIENRLKVSRNTLYNWINDGIKKHRVVCNKVISQRVRLHAEKIGGEYRILGSDLNFFLEQTGKK